MELDSVEFHLREALDVVINQVMTLSRERQVVLLQDWSAEVSSMHLCSRFLRLVVKCSSVCPGVPRINLTPGCCEKGTYGDPGVQIVHIEFRIIHPAPGIPEALVQEMFHHGQGISREGLRLYAQPKARQDHERHRAAVSQRNREVIVHHSSSSSTPWLNPTGRRRCGVA
ncbi:hypothetical protein B296_00056551 [Ensete ventricosum]|uniref:Uncharacterized protein n=1 Tax=Ensete ventricosum TaxID=4639 RepID=A0A426X0B9_ENSVE|nr:hypothetical protein B296_00056551 [Ensete ventricosum]